MIKVAIVGRPNVGKSTLFNMILKKRVSIVDETEGVTRDLIYKKAFYLKKPFILIDSGGIDFSLKKNLDKEIILQSKAAIEQADIIIMVVDAKTGPLLLDKEISKLLLKSCGKKIFLAINKIDAVRELEDFRCLGIKEIIKVSASHNKNINFLLDKVFKGILLQEEKEIKASKIAIVGRSNVGKSSLLNFLLQKKRALVSEQMATTRDSLEEEIFINGKRYILIDTAGIRKKQKEKTVIEKFAFIRTKAAIEKSDICLLIIDAKEGLTSFDKKIFTMIEKEKKGCVLLKNKCDLLKEITKDSLDVIEEKKVFSFFISAITGKNIENIFPVIEQIEKKKNLKISTPVLNRFIQKCLQKYSPPMIKGKRLKIYYLTQLKSSFPKFILFVNNPLFMTKGYKKYLFNQFHKTFQYNGVFLDFKIAKRTRK